jgi:eukaryotic-like serine/threonine-protein kinase
MNSPFSEKFELLDRLAEEFAGRYRRGERPPLKEYVDRYPELADEIRELFTVMIEIESTETTIVPTTALPRQIGDYRIVREIGHGGMGVVYEAEQSSLGRRVALKVLAAHVGGDPTAAERFRREARAAARLHHTNIVPVFEVGQADGAFFYAMQFIQGQSLAQVVTELRRLRHRNIDTQTVVPAPSPDPTDRGQALAWSMLTGRYIVGDGNIQHEHGTAVERTSSASEPSTAPAAVLPGQTDLSSVHSDRRHYFKSVARVGHQVAGALAYAHGRGIIHRDIKPSNLLLDAAGVVWITDFGLAKTEGDCLTETGALLGTFLYMSPERFRGQCDARADVYALGLTLYELLLLRPAFDCSDRAQLVRVVQEEEPPRPRSVDPRVPRDLETIVVKATAKEPARRYRTAEEMGEDLRRFIDGEPIRARRTSAFEQLRLWCRRNPAIAGLFAVLFVMVIGVSLTAIYLDGLLRQSEVDRQDKEKAEQRAVEGQFDSIVAAADARRFSRQIGQRFETLDAIKKAVAIARERHLPPERLDRLRTIAIAALAQPDMRTIDEWQPFGSEFTEIFHADSAHRLVAVALRSGHIIVCRAPDYQEVARVEYRSSSVRLSPDGRFLLAFRDHRFRVWDISGTEARVVLTDAEHGVMFQPGSRRLLVCRADHSLALLDLFGEEPERAVLAPSINKVSPKCFDASGKQLLVTVDGIAHVVDVASGEFVKRLGHYGVCENASWHPNGRFVALVIAPWTIEIWDTESNHLLNVLEGMVSGGVEAAFTSDGELLVGWGWEDNMRVWQFRTGKQVLHRPRANNVSFSSDGHCLFRSGRRLVFAEFVSGRECRDLGAYSRPADNHLFGSGSIHPDGRLLAVVSNNGTHFWDLETGDDVLWAKNLTAYRAIFLSRDELVIHNLAELASLQARFEGVDESVLRLGPMKRLNGGSWAAFSSSNDGATIAQPMYRANGVSLLTRRGSDWTVRTLNPGISTNGTAVSPDGRTYVTVSLRENRRTQVWDSADGRELANFDAGFAVGAAFSPDNRWLAINGSEMRRLVRVGKWDEGIPLEGRDGVMAFSPSGDLLAIDSGAGVVQCFDPETGKERVRFEVPDPHKAFWLGFSPDGAHLVTICQETNVVHVWDLRLIRSELCELGLDWNTAPLPVANDRPKPRLSVDIELAATRTAELPDPSANLLVNGSFEDGPAVEDFTSLDPGSTAIKGWTVTRGQIDYIGDYWQSADGRRSLDLHGSPGYGGIQQTFKTRKGHRYRVTFALAGTPGSAYPSKRMGVSAAGQECEFTFDAAGKTFEKMGWVTKEWEFDANADETTLEIFTLEQKDNCKGPAIDDVRVVPVASANLLVNGSFEDGLDVDEFKAVERGSTAITGWIVTRGPIDLIADRQAADGKVFVDLHGSPGYGGIKQTFKTTKGQCYRVTFSLAGSVDSEFPVKRMGVSAAGKSQEFTFDSTGKTRENMGWVTKEWTFEAVTEQTGLEFFTLESRDPYFGPALDNVRVEAVSTAK